MYRVYQKRLGRFLSIDPLSKKYPFNSTFAFAENSPISGIDLEGLEYYFASSGKFLGQRTTDSKGNQLSDEIKSSVRLATNVKSTDKHIIYEGVKDLKINITEFKQFA